jgi:hypothetical protein
MTILIGNKIVDTMLFQAIDDPVPRKDSPCAGNSRVSVPESELEINWKTNPKTRKRITNFVLEIFIMLIFVIHN